MNKAAMDLETNTSKPATLACHSEEKNSQWICMCVCTQVSWWLSCCSVTEQAEGSINIIIIGDYTPSRTTHVRNATVVWDQSVHQIASGGPVI